MQPEEWVAAVSVWLVDEWGLKALFADKIAVLLYFMLYYGLNPRINSGYRSGAKQAELLQRWEDGDPGIVVKPAEHSKHSKVDGNNKPAAQAIDIGHDNSPAAKVIANYLKIGYGGDFRTPDYVHFYEIGV